MLTVRQFCNAVGKAGEEGGFNLVGKAIRWGYSGGGDYEDCYYKPICDLLKGSGKEIPKYIRDACAGRNLRDSQTLEARIKIEKHFFGEYTPLPKYSTVTFTCKDIKTAHAIKTTLDYLVDLEKVEWDRFDQILFGPMTGEQWKCFERAGVTVKVVGKGPLWVARSNAFDMLEKQPQKIDRRSWRDRVPKSWQNTIDKALAV